MGIPKFKVTILVVMLILLATISWLMYKDRVSNQIGKNLDTLNISAYAGDFTTLIWLAQANNLFEKNGLNVTIEEHDNGVAPLEDLIAQKADVATAAEFVFVSHYFNNQKLKIISQIDQADAIYVIAKKSAGINSPEDLVNKNIGLLKTSQAEFLFADFLISKSLNTEQLNVISMTPSEMLDKLNQGAVDAVVVWDPFAYKIAEALGADAIKWSTQDGQKFYFLALTREDVIKQKNETLKKFIKALLTAEAFAKDYPNEAKALIQKKFSYSAEYTDYFWGKNNFGVFLKQPLLLSMENEARWMTKKAAPNFLENIYLNLLEQAAPNKISIIH